MAGGASHLALRDLVLQGLKRATVPGQVDHVPSFASHVVKLEYKQICAPTVGTRGAAKDVVNMEHVPALTRSQPDARLDNRGVGPPGMGSPCRSASVAIDADDLAVLDLILDPADRPPFCDEDADIGSLRTHVIELQN